MRKPEEMDEATAPAWDSLRKRVKAQLQRRASGDLADDVTQEVMLSLLRHLDQINDEAHLDRWLRTVARHRLFSEYRRRATRAETQAAAGGGAALPEATDEPSLNDVVGSWLSQEIKTLPEPYARALVEVDLGGKSQADFAKEHGLSPSGARTRIQRARKRLLEHLETSCETRRDARGNIIVCEPRGRCCDTN